MLSDSAAFSAINCLASSSLAIVLTDLLASSPTNVATSVATSLTVLAVSPSPYPDTAAAAPASSKSEAFLPESVRFPSASSPAKLPSVAEATLSALPE